MYLSPQRVYYLSMEYYMGRSLTNAMVNLGIDSEVEEAIYEVRIKSSLNSNCARNYAGLDCVLNSKLCMALSWCGSAATL